MEIAETFTERSLRRNGGAMLVEPPAKSVEDRSRVLAASCASLFGAVAGEGRSALDGEDAKSFERDLIAGACGLS